jgi:hypothetical protein
MSEKPNAPAKKGKSKTVSKRRKKMEFLNNFSKMSPEEQNAELKKMTKLGAAELKRKEPKHLKDLRERIKLGIPPGEPLPPKPTKSSLSLHLGQPGVW